MAVGEQGTIDWHPLGAQGKPQGAAGDTGASSTIEPTLEMDEPGLEDSAIGMPAIWPAPPECSHANPPVTGMEITSDAAASRPARRKEARIIVSIYRLNPRKKVIRVARTSPPSNLPTSRQRLINTLKQRPTRRYWSTPARMDKRERYIETPTN